MKIKRVLAVCLLLGSVIVAGSAGAQASGYRLVVNKANPIASLSKDEVARMFMKQTARWPGGAVVEPVDQAPSAGVRERFSEHVHGKAVGAVQSAWQRVVYSGRGVPPPEVSSDEKVLSYVAEHAGGIGYVSENAATDRVRVIEVTR